MMYNHVNEMKPEEAQEILAGLVTIRQAADEYDWEAARQNPLTKYTFHSAAEKFGYDAWKYMIEKGVISGAKQEKLPL
ncbi:MAG: hypothetical protein IJH64_04850 [Oscillospiraceae bacterium]|nr:hypothetical protein [Oscillospiraceae bacterium]